jgi:hypothetical protein
LRVEDLNEKRWVRSRQVRDLPRIRVAEPSSAVATKFDGSASNPIKSVSL